MHDVISHRLANELATDTGTSPGVTQAERLDTAAPSLSASQRTGTSSVVQRFIRWWHNTMPNRPYLSLIRRVLAPLPDRWYLALGHLAYFHSWPNYRQPRTFNEHIQAYMLRSRNPLLKVTADKLAMREFVTREVGAEYLVPLLGVWLDPDDVPFEKLPCPCVIKASVGSGMVMIRDEGSGNQSEPRRSAYFAGIYAGVFRLGFRARRSVV